MWACAIKAVVSVGTFQSVEIGEELAVCCSQSKDSDLCSVCVENFQSVEIGKELAVSCSQSKDSDLCSSAFGTLKKKKKKLVCPAGGCCLPSSVSSLRRHYAVLKLFIRMALASLYDVGCGAIMSVFAENVPKAAWHLYSLLVSCDVRSACQSVRQVSKRQQM